MSPGHSANSSFLETMAEHSKQRVLEAKRRVPFETIQTQAQDKKVFPLRTLTESFNIIAEVKLRSPAAGALADDKFDYISQAQSYASGGATAISVLTEPSAFSGSLEHLHKVVEAVSSDQVPVMRKDFLVEPYQIYEAKTYGASGALIIVRILSDDMLLAMLDAVEATGLFALIEAFDQDDLDRCHRVVSRYVDKNPSQFLIGLNCRDLASLQIKPERFADYVDHFPKNGHKVAESGLLTTDDVIEVAKQGYDMALIGSALMRSNDSAQVLRTMLVKARS